MHYSVSGHIEIPVAMFAEPGSLQMMFVVILVSVSPRKKASPLQGWLDA